MRVSVTFEFDDDARRDINRHVGHDGLATRKELQDWMWMHINLALECLDVPVEESDDVQE